ncbi:DNA cytosine methyltransferase [Pseudomonas sp. NPDC089918]|uniref:DNA cytosine methyltransferase n=1 Tax=Pseudomonas sp. NPDC089918 TaxID=3390654 RepID=UPI003D08846F
MKDKVQVIDLFCGAGGLSWGFASFKSLASEFSILGGVDFNQASLETYKKNIGAKTVKADLGVIASCGKTLRAFVDSFEVDPSLPLIIIGGPPCQGFSAHSKKQRNGDDNRNGLVNDFAIIALAFKPDVVIFENVPEVMTKKNWPFFEPMLKIFESDGMHVSAKVHNLAEFGVPQERFRTLVIASRTALPSIAATHAPNEYVTVREAIGALPPVLPGARSEDEMHFCASHRLSTVEIIKKVPVDGGNRPQGIGPKCLDKVDGYRDVYGRLSWDKPAVTITASARNPASGRFSHPEQNRGLTVREAALLQGFPLSYFFEGAFDEKFLQIGNAVPPVFSYALAGFIMRSLIVKKDGQKNDIAQGIPSKKEILAPIKNSFSSSIFAYKRRDPSDKYQTN